MAKAKRGRPPEDNPKNKMFTMRLNEQQINTIRLLTEAISDEKGVPITTAFVVQSALFHGIPIVAEQHGVRTRKVKRKKRKKSA